MKDLLTITELSSSKIIEIFKLANLKEQLFVKYHDAFRQKILATLFFQPSTRTQLSSQSAFIKLGGQCIGFSDIEDSRSGSTYHESMKDLGHILESYCDLVVMRCNDSQQIYDLSNTCHVPIISAGHGNVEHPTQALIDLYTLWSLYKRIDNINIVIVGTIPSRSMNSLILGLSKFSNNNVFLIGNNEKKVFNNNVNYFTNISSFLRNYTTLNKIDAIYLTEIKDCMNCEEYIFTQNQLDLFENAKILSPLPRTNILPQTIDKCSHAYYFKEAQNGIYVRGALYLTMLKTDLTK